MFNLSKDFLIVLSLCVYHNLYGIFTLLECAFAQEVSGKRQVVAADMRTKGSQIRVKWKKRKTAEHQGDQIGRFFKVLGDKFSYISCLSICLLFGLFWKTSLWSKNCLGHFQATFRSNWATFYFNIWSHCTPQKKQKQPLKPEPRASSSKARAHDGEICGHAFFFFLHDKLLSSACLAPNGFMVHSVVV